MLDIMPPPHKRPQTAELDIEEVELDSWAPDPAMFSRYRVAAEVRPETRGGKKC